MTRSTLDSALGFLKNTKIFKDADTSLLKTVLKGYSKTVSFHKNDIVLSKENYSPVICIIIKGCVFDWCLSNQASGLEVVAKRILTLGLPSGVTQAYSIGDNGYAKVSNDPNMGMKGTCFPCNGIVAATMNDELVYRVGQLIGEDSMWAGYAGLYGTGLNIHRSPYAGRVFEYYSEDGTLTGLIDTAETIGIQEKGVYVYNKHFVLNDQEKNRAGIGTWVNEQALREIYLRAFELPIVNADAKCVMTAFNRLGAIWAGSYRELLTDWLRGEAGMSGFAVTDMYDNAYMVKVHEILAGNDIPDNLVGEDTKELAGYENNPVVVNRMRESSKRVLYTVLHSRGMDGINDNVRIVSVTPWWQTALNVTQTVMIVLALASTAWLVLDMMPKKKQ